MPTILQELLFADVLRRGSDPAAPVTKVFEIEARFSDVTLEDMTFHFEARDLGPKGSQRVHDVFFQINKRKDAKRWETGQNLTKIRNNRAALKAFLVNGFLLHGHTNFWCSCECFTGETLIKMLDGTERRIDSLEQGKQYWIYSSDENGNFIPKLATALGQTKIANQLVEVTLDNGKKERCSLNHEWRLRDGSYKSAKDLKIGDSLLPLYTSIDDGGYEQIFDNDFKKKRTHTVDVQIIECEPTQLYDLYVPDTHNFALASGVYVHNSFGFGGFAYLATQEQSEIEGKAEQRAPNTTNPNQRGLACFTGETLIKLVDGTERRIDSILPGEEIWVYTTKNDGSIIPAKAYGLGETKRVKELVEIELDNGEKIRCTPEHLWRLRDGSYLEASKLVPEQSLMPLYTRLDKGGYEEFFDNAQLNWKKTHRVSAFEYNSIEEAWNRLKEISASDKHLTKENYLEFKGRAPKIETYFQNFDEILEAFQLKNHKVVSVSRIELDQEISVYDITVPYYENFALASGVFVHNCKHILGIIKEIKDFYDAMINDLQAKVRGDKSFKTFLDQNVDWIRLDIDLENFDVDEWLADLEASIDYIDDEEPSPAAENQESLPETPDTTEPDGPNLYNPWASST